jgi:hypothetical protein
MLQVLNEVAIKGRLTLALQAYIDTSKAPIAALESLAGTWFGTTPTTSYSKPMLFITAKKLTLCRT